MNAPIKNNVCLEEGKVSVQLNRENTIQRIFVRDIQVSLFNTPDGEKSLTAIFVRIKSEDGTYKLLDLFNDPSTKFARLTESLVWVADFEGLQVQTVLNLDGKATTGFFTVELLNCSDTSIECDVTYGQDIGLADAEQVKTNEAYCSQYLDQQPIMTEQGWVISCRQNISQKGKNPAIQVGCSSKAASFSTDAFQFFGTEYKQTGIPVALEKPQLANEVYQYEMAYAALQTPSFILEADQRKQTQFYFSFVDDLSVQNRSQSSELAPITFVESPIVVDKTALQASCMKTMPSLVGELMTEADLAEWFDSRREFEEYEAGELLSFFEASGTYVTLQAKETKQERPTGHIILTGSDFDHSKEVMCSTNYMFGVFNSQLCVGNTSFQKMMSVNRNALNYHKNTGQRIRVKLDGQRYVLGLCSAFAVSRTCATWFYKVAGGTIVVRSFTCSSDTKVQLDIEAYGFADALDIEVTHHLVHGNHESESVVSVAKNDNLQTVVSGSNELLNEINPNLTFKISATSGFNCVDTVVDSENQSEEYLIYQGRVAKKESLLIEANQPLDEPADFLFHAIEIACSEQALDNLTNHFDVLIEHEEAKSKKLNQAVHWFTHNALVHYSSPHGLEQYSGAAWGTRDASQGPFEFFMSLGKFEKAKSVLCKIYAHQYLETGTWPQWFMFDTFKSIQHDESHGDVVVWPLKALSDYIAATGDVDILTMKVPYSTEAAGHSYIAGDATLYDHVVKQIDHIEANLIEGSFLSSYGDGDWDDTLQPANQSLREKMVSGWTIPLTLQTFKTFVSNEVVKGEFADLCQRINKLASGMHDDYQQYLLKDDIVAGFIHVEDFNENKINYLLHPADQTTGIEYRLLPANRSIIAELFSKEQAEYNLNLIKEKLLYPDGVRLMDKLAKYDGGKQTYFKRAELAANLGREIGLNYVHAHIRFIEALCKLGNAKDLYDNVFKLIPMGIKDEVENAVLRQANSYFSSSDAAFNNRYEAYEGYEDLKAGKVGVKGGWRIYSSGPGIYINQIISNVLGIRYENGNLVLDPVVSRDLGNVAIRFDLFGKPVSIKIVTERGEHTPRRIILNGSDVEFSLTSNRYRKGGAIIDSAIKDKLSDVSNQLTIVL